MPTACPDLPPEYEKRAGKSDDTLQKATGLTWPEWVAALDAAGAATMEHGQIAAHVAGNHAVGAWWAQTVAVGYERLRGLREAGQRRSGDYEISKSATLPVSVEALWQALADPELRGRWMGEVDVEVRTATPPRTLRLRLADGTKLDAYLTSKGDAKSSLTLQHQGLADRDAADGAKALWGERLTALKALLAGGLG